MGFRIPGIHAVEDFRLLMHGDDGPLVKDVEIAVRNDGGDLNDAVDFGLQSRHLHVDPDEVVVGIGRITRRIGIC